MSSASDGFDEFQIVIILEDSHESRTTALFHRSFIDDIRIGYSVLGKRVAVIGDHDSHGSALCYIRIDPFAGKIALHLAVITYIPLAYGHKPRKDRGARNRCII